MDVASLADLLYETALRHGSLEAVAPPHDWWDWYAAYMDARQAGSTPDEAPRLPGATWLRPSRLLSPPRDPSLRVATSNGRSESAWWKRSPTPELSLGPVLSRRRPMASLSGCGGQPAATW